MGSVVFTSTYSGGGFASATFNLKVTFSETWDATNRRTGIKATAVQIQKVNNTSNFGSMTLRGYIRVNGSNLVSFGQGSASVTISISGGNYCSVSGFSSSTIYVNHDATGAASCTFATVQYGSITKIGAYYSSSYQLGVTAQSKSVTLTKRDAITYAVSYNANGHGTAPANQTKTHGTNLTLQPFIADQTEAGTTENFVVTGNANGGTWDGTDGSASRTPNIVWNQTYWNTNSAGTGTNYGSSATYTSNAALSLYAIWSSSVGSYTYTYTLPTGTPQKDEAAIVTFNANGGQTSKASESGTRAMTFEGWYTQAAGGTERTTNSQISSDETVWAHYSSGSGSYSSVTLPTIAECTKSGSNLLGWATSSSATVPQYLPGASYTPTGSIELFAVWEMSGSVHIDNGSSFDIYLIYIDNGVTWDQYIPYIDNGTTWDIYS